MRYSAYFAVLLLFIAISVSRANDPTHGIHWPVGSTEDQMNNTKTLMASYGDLVNEWGTFLPGIDIDSNTESENGDYVTEGFHNKMKMIVRRAYGFRNFANYRLRGRIFYA